MDVRIEELAEVAQALARRTSLDEQLQLLVERTAQLLGVERVGVRLLDPSRGRLIAVARAGAPLHRAPFADFGIGEGLMGWVVAQRKPLTTGDAEADARFVPRAGMLERLGSFVAVPLLVRDACIGVFYASHTAREQFGADHEQLLTLLAGLCAPHIESARLTRLSEIDALTGALNRRGADAMLDEKSSFSLVMCDLDWFKRINDQHGHAVGDEVLVRVAQLLASVLRGGDAVVRWGGEEFLLVLPQVDLEKAVKVAERALKVVADEALTARGLRITLSAGVAERRGAEATEQLLRRADQALYAAKRDGRNCVRRAS